MSPPTANEPLRRGVWDVVNPRSGRGWRLAILATALASAAPAAAAHGPCGCLSPPGGLPGTRVRVPSSYGAVEVLWNPDPRRLGNPALRGSRWSRLFRPDRDTMSLARRDRPGAIAFDVPRVPPGRYLVVIFDLSEGGPRNHYTWETFAVGPAPALPATGGGAAVVPWALAVAGAGAHVLWLARPRPRSARRRTAEPGASHADSPTPDYGAGHDE